MIKKLFVFLIAYGLFIDCFSQTPIVFEKEDLTFEITGDVFKVKGLYYFHAEQHKRTSLLYPFPTDSIYGKAYNINVQYANTGESIEFIANSDSSYIAFQIDIDRNKPIFIEYQQQLKSNEAKYILTTTQSWKQALKQAHFKLLTSPELVIKSFLYPPDQTIEIEGKILYIWQKEQFMPRKDFIITF